MKIKTSWTFAALLFLFMSCSVSEQQRFYLGKIDSLQKVLNTAATKYMKLDTLKITEADKMISRQLEKVAKSDSVGRDTVTTYAFIQKSLKKLNDERINITGEIIYSKEQLHALRHDVRKNLLSEEDIPKYLGEEEEAVHNLLDKMWFNKESILYQLKSFDHLHVTIENILRRQEKKK